MVQAFSYWTDDKLESKNKCQNEKERNQSLRSELLPQTWCWNHLKIKLIVSFYLSSPNFFFKTTETHCISSLPVSSLLILLWLHFPPVQPLPSGQRLCCQDIELKVPFQPCSPCSPANSLLLKALSLSAFLSPFLAANSFWTTRKPMLTGSSANLCCSTSTWPWLLFNNPFNHHLLTHGTFQRGSLPWASVQV